MKHFLLLLTILISLSACRPQKEAIRPNPLPLERNDGRGLEFSPATLIVMVSEDIGKEPLYKAIKQYGATLKYDYSIIPGVAIRIPEGTTLEQGIAYFKKVKGVVSVNKDRITRLTDPVKPRLERE